MKYNADQHRRRSIRLQGYDYAQGGAYFITICTHGRECIFSDIVDGDRQLTDPGKIVEAEWLVMPDRFPTVELDAFVVMPNHFHALVVLHAPNAVDHNGISGPTLGNIVRAFKARTSVAIRRQVALVQNVWQRNYYEHIVRSVGALQKIRQYILDNPASWAIDQENPAVCVRQSGRDKSRPYIADLTHDVGAQFIAPLIAASAKIDQENPMVHGRQSGRDKSRPYIADVTHDVRAQCIAPLIAASAKIDQENPIVHGRQSGRDKSRPYIADVTHDVGAQCIAPLNAADSDKQCKRKP